MSLTTRLFVTLIVTWLLFSGLFKAQLLILGLMSVVLITWLGLRMRVTEHRGEPLYFRFGGLLRYFAWLAVEIIRSNIAVTRRVFSRDLDIAPAVRPVEAMPTTALGEVLYANSITLTPGTTTICFTPDGKALVHALHESSLAELDEGGMASRVHRVEPDFAPSVRARHRSLS